MPDYLSQLKQAEQQLSTLYQAIPDLHQSLDHYLHTYFVNRPKHYRTDNLYITYQALTEPEHTAQLISYSLAELIEHSYITRRVPTYVQNSTAIYNHANTLAEQHLARGFSIVQIENFVRHVINNLKHLVKDALEHFWSTPHTKFKGKAPKYWLSDFVRSLITTETELRHTDKTLSAAGYAAIKQILTYPTSQARSASGENHPLSVYNVALKGQGPTRDIPLHGLLVIVDGTASGLGDIPDIFNIATQPPSTQDEAILQARKAVLYMPGSGLEEFDSLHALSQELQARLSDDLQREALLDCTLLNDRERALGRDVVGYRETTSEVFDTYAQKLIDIQSQNVTYAWETAKTQNTQYDLEALADEVERALNMSARLNPTGILKARYTRLLESQLPTWLTTAPEESKQQWRQAVDRLTNERLISQTTEDIPLLEYGQKNTLLGYAKTRLKQRIKADHQLDIDPDQIFISTTEVLNTSPGLNPLNLSSYSAGKSIHITGPTLTRSHTRRSLSELALENIGLLDINFAMTARVHDAKGKPYPLLSTAYLKTLVRDLNAGETYKALLHKTLLDPNSAQVAWRKERYVAVTAAQLSLDILEAKLAGHLTREEAGWVETALNYPVEKNRPLISGKLISVEILLMRTKPMPGIWVISLEGSTRLLCYTPNAPDKIWFRRANSLDELATELSIKTLNSYVLQHVSIATQAYVKHALKEGLKASYAGLSNLGGKDFLSDLKKGFFPYIGVGSRVVTADFLQVGYDIEAAFAIRNADEQSTSTYEANVQTTKDVVWAIIDVVSFALPTKLLLVVAVLRFIQSTAQGIDAHNRGEKLEAMFHFLDSISHLTDGASDFAGSAVFGKSIRQRHPTPAAALNPKAASTRAKTNLKLRNSDEYGTGIYEYTEPRTGQTRYYVQGEQDKLYRSQYDNLNETWRVIDERQPNTMYQASVIQVSSGLWNINPTSSTRLPNYISLRRLIEKAAVNIQITANEHVTNGIYKINDHYYIQQDSHVFEIKFNWLRRSPHLFVPGTSLSHSNTYKIRRNYTDSTWEVRRTLNNTKQWNTLRVKSGEYAALPGPTTAVDISAYYMAPEHHTAIKTITAPPDQNLHDYSFLDNAKLENARKHFVSRQKLMHSSAVDFFQNLNLTRHISLPNIIEEAAQNTIVKSLLDKYQGFAIGEAHNSTASKKFIIDNFSYLADNNVKTLFLEHLQSDLHQQHLDVFFKTGRLHTDVSTFLKNQDKGHNVDRLSNYTFTQLVLESRRHGIQVKALDCVASYHTIGINVPEARSARHKLFSYGASEVIRKNTTQNPSQKWIALVGNTHTNTYLGVPGLAEILDSVGVRVDDVAPGAGQRINPGNELTNNILKTLRKTVVLKSDFVLNIESPRWAPRLTPEQLDATLSSPGLYLIQNSILQEPVLIHRSRSGSIIRSVFILNDDNTFKLKQDQWPEIRDKTYKTLDELTHDLNTKVNIYHVNNLKQPE